MSPSRDNLRAVEAPTEEPILPPLLDKRTKETVTDLRWLLALGFGSVAAVVIGTVSTVAFAQEAGGKAAKAEVAGLSVEQAALKANVRDLRDEVADVKAEVRESRVEIRELRRALQVALPKMPPPADGGP